jgi:hypothetical protein
MQCSAQLRTWRPGGQFGHGNGATTGSCQWQWDLRARRQQNCPADISRADQRTTSGQFVGTGGPGHDARRAGSDGAITDGRGPLFLSQGAGQGMLEGIVRLLGEVPTATGRGENRCRYSVRAVRPAGGTPKGVAYEMTALGRAPSTSEEEPHQSD